MNLEKIPTRNTTELHGCPPYIYAPNGIRAFLTLIMDLRGTWGVGYMQWFEPVGDLDGPAGYKVVGEAVSGADSVDSALRQLAAAMKEKKAGR